MNLPKLRAHPRLYITADHLRRLEELPRLPFLQEAQVHVSASADQFLRTELSYPEQHNALLSRARLTQIRVLTFLLRWQQTGKPRYRSAVLAIVHGMKQWEYWSWIAWRKQEKEPEAIFDLSYGENSATLAIAYDWLHGTLNESERKLFLDTAEKWSFASGLKHCRSDAGTWFFGKEDSNWNTVCTGGLGMLALAMHEESAAARKILPQVERSVRPFILHLDAIDGAWPEGTGYWNYGMRYAFMYLLSHSNATGTPHPLLKRKGVRKTLRFPLDFCPNGIPCSFGDVNRWSPLPFHYLIAEFLGDTEVLARLDAHEKVLRGNASWPDAAEWLLFHSRKTKTSRRTVAPFHKIYKGLGWAILADRMPKPGFYLSIRGGTTRVPHGQRDLMSFFCVVGNEALISNCRSEEYLDTTFSERREELFEIGPWSKNSLFINGVGICTNSELDNTSLMVEGSYSAVRLIATTAMGSMRDGPAALFCGRLMVMLEAGLFLIIDRFDLPHVGRVENRLHSYFTVKKSRQGAVIQGLRNSLTVTYASSVPARLLESTTAPTTPRIPSTTLLRWCSESLHKTVTFATLLGKGTAKGSLELDADGKDITVRLRRNGKRYSLRCSTRLRMI